MQVLDVPPSSSDKSKGYYIEPFDGKSFFFSSFSSFSS